MAFDQDSHLKRPVSCEHCGWIGITGDLIASGRSSGLQCPQCKATTIKYIRAETTERIQ